MKGYRKIIQSSLTIILVFIMVLTFNLDYYNNNNHELLGYSNELKAYNNKEYRGTILNVPIDSRPITTSNFQYLVEAAGYQYCEVGTADLDKMGAKQTYTPGDSAEVRDSLTQWVAYGLSDPSNTTVIINTASYFFGGLMASRSPKQYNNMKEKIKQLETTITNYNDPEYYVIITIPRTYPDSRVLKFPMSANAKVKGLQEYYKECEGSKNGVIFTDNQTTFQDAVLEWVYFRYWQKIDNNKWSQLPVYAKQFCSEFYNSNKNFLENYYSTYEKSYEYIEELLKLNNRLKKSGYKQFTLIVGSDDFAVSPFISKNVVNAGKNNFNYIQKNKDGKIVKIGPAYYYNKKLEDKNCILIPGADEIHHMILARDLVNKTKTGIDFRYLDPVNNKVNLDKKNKSNDNAKLGVVAKYDAVSARENFLIRENFINKNAKNKITVDTYLIHITGKNLTENNVNKSVKNIFNNSNKHAVIGVHYFDDGLFEALVKEQESIFNLPYCSAWNTIGNSAGIGLASITVAINLEEEIGDNSKINAVMKNRVTRLMEYKYITVLEGIVYNNHKTPTNKDFTQETKAQLYNRISYVNGNGSGNGKSLVKEMTTTDKKSTPAYQIGGYKFSVSNVEATAQRPWNREFEVKIIPKVTIK